jgi:aryl-alcohol dehydrogenase-like predicted oxidoreductase
MDSGHLGGTDLVVSRLGMGCNKLGSISARQSRRSALALVERAVESGVRLFDTADAYGSGLSESILGEALRHAGSQVVVATKVGYRFDERSRAQQLARLAASSIRRIRAGGSPRLARRTYAEQDFSAAYVRAAVCSSLKRLRREQIDLLQFHGPPPAESSDLPVVIEQLIDEGLVRYFGVGCEHLDTAQSWIAVSGLAAVQVAFGVLDPQAADLIRRARLDGLGVIVRGVLGGGLLARFGRGQQTGLDPQREQRLQRLAALAKRSGTDIMQLAVWYGMHAVESDSMLLGMSNTEQLMTGVRMASSPRPPSALLAELAELADDRTAREGL